MMILEWPQITYAVLALLGLGMALARHGEPKGNWSFGWAVVGTALTFWLLYEGGFWTQSGLGG